MARVLIDGDVTSVVVISGVIFGTGPNISQKWPMWQMYSALMLGTFLVPYQFNKSAVTFKFYSCSQRIVLVTVEVHFVFQNLEWNSSGQK